MRCNTCPLIQVPILSANLQLATLHFANLQLATLHFANLQLATLHFANVQVALITFRYGYISLQLQRTTVTIRNGYNTFRYVTNPYFITSYITIANLHFSILSFALHRET